MTEWSLGTYRLGRELGSGGVGRVEPGGVARNAGSRRRGIDAAAAPA